MPFRSHAVEAAAERLQAAARQTQSAAERIEASLEGCRSDLQRAPEEALAPVLRYFAAKLDAALTGRLPPSIEPTLADIGDKLDRVLAREPEQETDALGSIERELKSIRAAVDAPPAPTLDRETAERLIEGLARRLEDRLAGEAAAAATAGQFERLAGRLEAAASHLGEAAALQSAARNLLETLQEERSKSINTHVAEQVLAFGQERAAGERRIEALIEGLQAALEKAIDGRVREADGPTGAAGDQDTRSSAVEAAGPAHQLADIDDAAPRRAVAMIEETGAGASPPAEEAEDEFLLEPGAAAPQSLSACPTNRATARGRGPTPRSPPTSPRRGARRNRRPRRAGTPLPPRNGARSRAPCDASGRGAFASSAPS